MPYIAAFDIGTTQAKGVLVSPDAKNCYEKNVDIHTIQHGNRIEQNPEQWLEAVISIATSWFISGVQPDEITLITFSGQMQDCIPIDDNGRPVRNAILYADGRASKQAENLSQQLPIHQVTANHMDGTLTFPKMVWMQEEEPELFEQTAQFLISSKDYVIRHLTGVSVTDPTSAATTGLMNRNKQAWEVDWLPRFDIPANKLPAISLPDQVVGWITEDAANQTGFAKGTPVLCGIGDAGATTMGAGVFLPGELYVYLGTTGWVATPVQDVSTLAEGVFHLSYLENAKYLAIAPIMNAGNAHRWAVSVFGQDQLTTDYSYEQFEKRIQTADRSQNELLFLPYLNGERCPIQDSTASGCFIGIRPTTTSADLSCAVLEGVAMAMRQVMELVSPDPNHSQITLIGGGSKSEIWNQIIADVFNKEVVIPLDAPYLPSIGAAAFGAKYVGWETSMQAFVYKALQLQSYKKYCPNQKMVSHYNRKYQKYAMLYDALKDVFAPNV